ncbi:MAG: FAD-dependent oxidoreductase [Armatimonadia bacterium]|nr:FAD-dependent oxidoreductase [Armatimonadia bacterium]
MSELEIRDTLDAPETIDVRGEALPIAAVVDVVVAGGGPAGTMAAIAAGRQGADVILVEAQPFLGGIGTGGPIHHYYWGLSGGLQDELDRRNADLDPMLCRSVRGWHPEGRKLALDTMAENAGVDVWLRTSVVGTIVEDGTVRGVVVDGERGRAVIIAHVTIDATGDGDVAALAGAEWMMGREVDGMPMAYSLTPGVSHPTLDAQVSHANFDAGWVYPNDPVDYSRGFTNARRHLWRERYDEDNRLQYCGPILGVREARTVLGEYVLTHDDLFFGQCFADTIGKTRSHYDNHARDYALEGEEARVYCDVTGNWKSALECDLPYGVLVPQDLDGLLLSGRCISMTHDAAAAVRMMKDMHRIGEAAGIAAALAAREDVGVRDINVDELQRELVKTGILTDDEIEAGRREERRQPGDIEHLVERLGGERRELAMWELYCHRADAHDALLEAMEAGDERSRWAALVLGAQGVEAARSMLVKMVVERDETLPSNHPFVQPRWVSALACLVREPRQEELDLYVGALKADAQYGEPWLYALEGLEGVGAPKAAEAAHRFIERLRDDEQYWGLDYDPKRHPGWKFEMAAARALRAMGDPEGEEILRRYALDRRLTVRQYAEKLLSE